jgi:hypothetical protein
MPFPHEYRLPRRNIVKNTEMRGAVAGFPGTMPTNMLIVEDPPVATNNITTSNSGASNEDGMKRLDLAWTTGAGGTFNAGNLAIILSDYTTNSALNRVGQGQTFTFSMYVKVVAAPGLVPSFAMQINEYDASGQFVAFTVNDIFPTTNTLSSQRWAVSTRIVNATTTHIRPILGMYYELAETFDFRIGMAKPQLERGSVATRPEIRLV